jgi:hypothetical protein
MWHLVGDDVDGLHVEIELLVGLKYKIDIDIEMGLVLFKLCGHKVRWWMI